MTDLSDTSSSILWCNAARRLLGLKLARVADPFDEVADLDEDLDGDLDAGFDDFVDDDFGADDIGADEVPGESPEVVEDPAIALRAELDALIATAEEAFGELSSHAEEPSITDEIDAYANGLKEARVANAEGLFGKARRKIAELASMHTAAKERADAAFEAHSKYDRLLAQTEAAIGQFADDVHAEAVVAERDAVQTAVARARDMATGEQFQKAAEHLEAVANVVAAVRAKLAKLGQRRETFEALHSGLTAKLETLEGHAQSGAVAAECGEMRRKLDVASVLGKALQYSEAADLLRVLAQLAKNALATATAAHVQWTAYDEARKLAAPRFVALKKHAKAELVAVQIAAIQALFASAELQVRALQFDKAVGLVERATTEITAAADLAGRISADGDARFQSTLEFTEQLEKDVVQFLASHAQKDAPSVTQRLAAGREAIAAAKALAKESQFVKAVATLIEKGPELNKARLVAEKLATEAKAYDEYLATAKGWIAFLQSLEGDVQADHVKELEDLFVAIAATAAGHEYVKAKADLSEAWVIGKRAKQHQADYKRWTTFVPRLDQKIGILESWQYADVIDAAIEPVRAAKTEGERLAEDGDYGGAVAQLALGDAAAQKASTAHGQYVAFVKKETAVLARIVRVEGAMATPPPAYYSGLIRDWREEVRQTGLFARRLELDVALIDVQRVAASVEDFCKGARDYFSALPVAESKLRELKKHKHIDVCAERVRGVEEALRDADEKAQEGRFTNGSKFLAKATKRMAVVERRLTTYSSYMDRKRWATDRVEFLDVFVTAEGTLGAKVAAARAHLVAGVACGDGRDFRSAKGKFSLVHKACATAEETFASEYLVDRESAIDSLKRDTDKAIIENLLQGLAVKLAAAKKLAAANKYRSLVGHSGVLADLLHLTATASRVLGNYKAFVEVRDKLTPRIEAVVAGAQSDEFATAVARFKAAQAEAEELAKQREFKAATQRLRTALADAERVEAVQKKQVEFAASQGAAAAAVASVGEEEATATAAIAEAKKVLQSVRDHEHHGALAEDLAAIDRSIADAERQLSDPAAVKLALETVLKGCTAARLKADRHGEYSAALTAAKAAAHELQEMPGKEAVADRLAKITAAIAAAEVAGGAGDYPAAMTQLTTSQRLVRDAQAKIKLAACLKEDALDPDTLRVLLQEPGGGMLLDELVETAGGSAKRKVLAVAMEARFGLKLEMYTKDKSPANMEAEGKTLKHLYDLMNKVPVSHTRDNPKLAKIIRYGGSTNASGMGNFYRGSESMFTLSAGRVTSPSVTAVNSKQSSELGDIEAGCEANAEVADPPYLDFTALHEVGHTVDDKNGFMASNEGEDVNFGGWKTLGSDVTEVAAALKAKYDYDLNYIKQCLLGKNPAPVPCADTEPDKVTAWELLETKVKEWCAAVRPGSSLWKNDAKCQQLALGDRVYHEGYSNRWFTYKLAARKRGITGYQFRAPGEWFSELYAAYHCGKLKSGHPSESWLAKL